MIHKSLFVMIPCAIFMFKNEINFFLRTHISRPDKVKAKDFLRRVDYPIKSKGYRKKSTFPVECE
ncbi:hypothetical protein DI43_19430 [Geobacillus sp. CAMR12739]|nr:hypothetical protein DI43_19430 [Geobacillus sp. CAMR12739]